MDQQSQMQEMLRLQDMFNQIINPNWKDAGYPFHQAVMVEGAEATEHMTYKWWKGEQIPNLKQTWIEMVDIWHFGLSMMLIPKKDPCTLSGFHKYMRKVIHAATSETPWFDVDSFMMAMEMIGMTKEDLYRLYVMKNVLNVFRQKNGYNDGTYIKDWGGEFAEDNVYLEHLFAQKTDWTFEELYAALETKYAEVKEKTHDQ